MQAHLSSAAAAGQRKSWWRSFSSVRFLFAGVCLASLSAALPADPIATNDTVRWGTNLATDYDRGVAEHKPVVVLFYDVVTTRTPADLLSTQILMSAKLGKAANSAVWSFADVSNDIVAKNMAKALGIKTLPTISVLKPNPDAIDETARLVGVLAIDTTEIGIMQGIGKASQK
jgi:hypothetical protein